METQIAHFCFIVNDQDRLVDFYESVFGLGPANVGFRDEEFTSAITGIEGAKIKVAYMQGPNCALELIKYVQAPGIMSETTLNNLGASHIALSVADFANTLQKALDCGATMPGTPARVPSGPNQGRTVVYIQDPEGNNIELMENPS